MAWATAGWPQAGAPATGLGVVSGTVTNADNSEPLPGVMVIVFGTKKSAQTAADGSYTIDGVPAGTYDLHFELTGFVTSSKRRVVVTADEATQVDASLRLLFAHEVTVTARRDETSLRRVSENVEVLTADEIEQTPANDLYGALNTIIGVDVDTNSAVTRTGTFLYVDGYSDVYVRKMVDGVDVSQVVSNWSLLNAYPEEMIQQVEVVKGGSSAAWGSNMGGIINVITKRPTDLDRMAYSLRARYSAFGKMNYEEADADPNSGDLTTFAGNVQDTVGDGYFMLGGTLQQHDGFVEDGDEDNYSPFGKFGYTFDDSSYIDALYSYNKVGANAHAFRSSPAGSPLPYVWNYYQSTDAVSQVGSFKFFNQTGASLGIEAQLKFNQMDYDSYSDYFAGASSNLGPAGTRGTSSFVDQKIGGTFQATYDPAENLSLVTGIDYYRIKADFSDFIANQPVIHVDSTAPFVNLAYQHGDLGLHVGARYDDDSSFGSQLSPSFGLHYQILSSTMVRANVARTFRVPPLWYTLGASYFNFILPNPDLGPESAWAYSLGFESQELRYFYAKLSYYRHDMENGIVPVLHPTIPFTYTWDNASDFTRKGFEGELGFLIPGGVTAYVAYNENDHTNDTTDNVVTGIPTEVRKAGLKYRQERLDLLVNLRGRWIDWNLSPGSSFYPARDKVWLVDLRVAKGFLLAGQRLELSLDVFNLTDELYWDRADTPNPRRWAALGIGYSFR